MRARVATIAVCLAFVACSQPPRSDDSTEATTAPTAAPPSVLEPGAFRPSAPPSATAVPSAVAPARPLLPPEPVHVHVAPVSVPSGEDGHGHSVAATHPVAIDLVAAHGWRGGGLATTLTVGALRFHDMGYPSITTMRFIVADEARLPRDAEVALEVGSSLRRRVLAPSLREAP